MRGPKPTLSATKPTSNSYNGTSAGGGSSNNNNTTAISPEKAAAAIQEGLALIQRGNEYFFSDCYLEATGYYYQAAMLLLKAPEKYDVHRSKAWSNVAECHLRLQNWQAAEDAASNAIAADPHNSKAFYRRAKARFELTQYQGAAQDAEAVGTQDAQDVADLCRELAQESKHTNGSITTVSSSSTLQGTTGSSPMLHPRSTQEEETLLTSVADHDDEDTSSTHKELAERSLWFRRIIDGYRLRVDDEYTQTGASDAGCLYGIRARGGHKPPLEHFKAFVRRALKKRVLPHWFSGDDMDTLCHMAMTDDFSNINVPVLPEEIVEFYAPLGSRDELKVLRDLAMYIEGPIGMPWNKELMEPGNKKKKHSLPKNNTPKIADPEVRRSWGNAGLAPVQEKKAPPRGQAQQQQPYTPERRYHNRNGPYHDPALMDKHSPYRNPEQASSIMTKSRGTASSHHHSRQTPSTYDTQYTNSTGPQYRHPNERTPPPPSSYQQPSPYQSGFLGMIQSAWRVSPMGGAQPPSPEPVSEQSHEVSEEQSGSYGPQLPRHQDDGRRHGAMSPPPYHPRQPHQHGRSVAPQYHNTMAAANHTHRGGLQYHPGRRSRVPAPKHPYDAYYDSRDDEYDSRLDDDEDGPQLRDDSASTTQEVRRGHRDFEEQVFSDLTELSP